MTESAKVIDLREMLAPPERLSALFHMVNRLLPEGQQEVVWVSPQIPARDALAVMRKHGYSQLPVK